MADYLELEKYSFGMGDRFGRQGSAQLRACMKAAELGATAAKAVLKRIRDPRRETHEHVMLPTQLVVRESTAPLQVGNQK